MKMSENLVNVGGGGSLKEFKTCFRPKFQKFYFLKTGFSIAEAMVTLLIVSVALAAAAPIMSKQIKSSYNTQSLSKQVQELQSEVQALRNETTRLENEKLGFPAISSTWINIKSSVWHANGGYTTPYDGYLFVYASGQDLNGKDHTKVYFNDAMIDCTLHATDGAKLNYGDISTDTGIVPLKKGTRVRVCTTGPNAWNWLQIYYVPIISSAEM